MRGKAMWEILLVDAEGDLHTFRYTNREYMDVTVNQLISNKTDFRIRWIG